jgi:hypothetical protein
MNWGWGEIYLYPGQELYPSLHHPYSSASFPLFCFAAKGENRAQLGDKEDANRVQVHGGLSGEQENAQIHNFPRHIFSKVCNIYKMFGEIASG